MESRTSPAKLTDLRLQAILKQGRTDVVSVPDGTVAGLSVRISPGDTAGWNLTYRVAGEGGINKHGRKLLGKKHSLTIGRYPALSIKEGRALANKLLADAEKGINPKVALEGQATAAGLTVKALSDLFMKEHVNSRELDSAHLYEGAFKTHINPQVGDCLADLITREEVRAVMEKARVKRKRPKGERGSPIGGVEAARTAMSVFRHMYSWAIRERKIKRTDNPCSMITMNLPKKKQGEVVLTLTEARMVYQAAALCGYPFGTQAQLEFLTALRLDNWASAQATWVDLKEALTVIPADSYKSDHVHVMPLVPQALDILKGIPKSKTGPYLLSSDGGSTPIRGTSKFYRTRLQDAIIAVHGEPLRKRITSQTIRRTVATGIAEILGYQGEKLVKRVLGHSDGSVTAIYNRYGYVREMRRALEQWANELLAEAAAPCNTRNAEAA